MGAVILAVSTISPAMAQAKKVTFPEMGAKDHLYGPQISKADIRGKVLFVEVWGIKCTPCILFFPSLVDLQKKFGSQNFMVIGNHCQGKDASVVKFLKEKKTNFPVYQSLNIGGFPSGSGLPHSAIIGPDGTVLDSGHPNKMKDKVAGYVSQFSKGYPILGSLELKQHKSLQNSLLNTTANLSAKIDPLRSKTDEESVAVCAAFDAWLAEEKSVIQSAIDNNPLSAESFIVAFKKSMPNDTDFDEALETIRKNPELKKLADVRKQLNSLLAKKNADKKVSDDYELFRTLSNYIYNS